MCVSDKLARALFGELFDKNFEQYKESLSKVAGIDTDPYGKARSALAQLSDTHRSDVFEFFKVIIADSASVVLGTLDGVHFPDNFEGDLVLTCDGEIIQGDLMDTFVSSAQDIGVYG